MNVGIPGTGIGGLFYLLSGIILLAYELVLALIGKSSKARIMFALRQGRLVFLVLVSLVAVDVLLVMFFKKISTVTAGGTAGNITVGILSVRPVVYGIFILLGVSFSTQILGWYYHYRQPIHSKKNTIS